MTWPSVVCLIVLVFGLFRPIGFLMSTSRAFMALGALAIFPTEMTGGLSLLAGTVATFFLILKAATLPGAISGILKSMADSRRLLLLTTYTLVAVAGAFILPVVFQNAIYVFPLRATRAGLMSMEPVAPSSTNVAQSAYLLISFTIAATYCWLATKPQFLQIFGRALIAGGIAVIVTGLIDIIADRLGAGASLSVFRTASYAFITSAELGGVKRTIGLTAEASSFGSLASSQFALLLFTRDMHAASLRKWVVLPLIAGCGVMAILSTSSTAYVSITVTLMLVALQSGYGLTFGNLAQRRKKGRELANWALIGIFLLFAALIFDNTRDLLFNLYDEVVLRKTASSSYTERMSWTNGAYDAWLESGGMGVGLGTVRASNMFINILASTGYLGFGLFIAFLLKVLLARPPSQPHRLGELVRGTKLALIPSLVGAALAGTTPDYGSVAVLFGIVIGGSTMVRRARKASYGRQPEALPDVGVGMNPARKPVG